jgi:hypothetical protein
LISFSSASKIPIAAASIAPVLIVSRCSISAGGHDALCRGSMTQEFQQRSRDSELDADCAGASRRTLVVL